MLRTAINAGRSTDTQKRDEFTGCGSTMIRSDRKIKAQFPSCIFIFALCHAVSGQAEPVDKAKLFKFNIPAEDMASALIAFSETTDMQLIYPAVLVKDIKSKALSGSYKPEQALQKLLAGSNVVYRYEGNDAIALAEAPKGDGSTTTLKAMTVTGKAGYADNDPYNPNYNRANATTATKTDTPIMLTPASIQVVPKAVMNDQQNTNILDSLNRNVSGVSARTGGALLYDNFIIRGFNTGLAGAAYRNGLLSPSNFYEPSNIEQLEVLKGPAAALYGRIEPGGIVNVTTKKPLATPYYALQQQFGSYDLYRTTVDATGPIDGAKTVLYRFNATYLEKGSFRGDMVNSDRVFIAPTLSWRPNDKFEANVELEYKHDTVTMDNGIPVLNGANQPANLPHNRYLGDSAEDRAEQENVLIGYDWTFHFNDDWKLTNRFLWEDWNIDQRSINPLSLRADNRTLNRGLSYGQRAFEAYTTNLDLNGKFDLFGTKHDVLVGGDFYDQRFPGDTTFQGATAAVPTIDIYNPVYGRVSQAALDRLPKNNFRVKKDQWFGVYFQDQITLWDKLHILGGGRYDWALSGSTISRVSVQDAKNKFSDQETQNFSPRVGLLYQPWTWLSVYGNYTQSFNVNSGLSASGQQFDPQIGEQFEAGFKTEFFDQRLSTSMAFYHLTKSNTLTADPNNFGFSLAIGEARSQGIEVDIKGQVTEQLSLISTYAYTDTRVTKDNAGIVGNELVNVPEHQASLWGTYQFTERFKVGLGEVLVGSRQGDANNTFQLPGYARTDAMAAYTVPVGKTRLTTQLNINNLLNKDYFSDSSVGGRNSVFFGEPISVMGSLKLEY